MRPWSDRWFELNAYFRHVLQAEGKHGVHSPFVFDLLTHCTKNSIDPSIRCELKELLRRMRRDTRVIQKTDWGTGKSGRVKVKNMAVKSTQPLQQAIFIARLAQHLGCKKMVELGTSLGITAAAMGRINTEAQVISIEGCANTAEIARENLNRYHLNHVKVISGEAMQVMTEMKTEMLSADFVFIDCNHTYRATEQFIQFFEASDNPHLTMVLDDIYWSREMNDAWRWLISKNTFAISIDFFHFGVVFKRQGKVKEDFTLRLPL
jgi:predicted O-methyltransferase YrrM